jgi:carbon storage regulator
VLVLTRKVGESIVIDGAIRVSIIGLKGGAVRLGVAAPLAVRVDRSEVHARRRGPVALVNPTPRPI